MIDPSPPVGDPAGRVDFRIARDLVLALAHPLPAERVALADGAGRVLAQTLTAQTDLVPFVRSAMDGYALRAADAATASPDAPVFLTVSGPVAYAGSALHLLPPGVAGRIATGAALPEGADAVVPFEDVEVRAGGIVLTRPLEPRAHLFEAGDDAKRGDTLARSGDVLTPGRVGLLAAGGYAEVAVRRRPRVAIVSTGDELVGIDVEPRPGQIRNSNAPMLAAALQRDGASVVYQTHARDTAGALQVALAAALERADLVITTGGASAGERDLVKATLRRFGARFAFDSVALRPAKPTGFAAVGTSLAAVLPGNPAAAYVAYQALVRGALRRLAGQGDGRPVSLRARLQAARVHRKPGRHYLAFATLSGGADGFAVTLLDNQCSSLTRTSADANALIVIEPGLGYVEPNEDVEVEVTDWDAVTFAPAPRC